MNHRNWDVLSGPSAMIFTWLAQGRSRHRTRLATAKQALYDAVEPERISEWQLQRLNQTWVAIVERIPAYQKRHSEGTLPNAFESWEAFTNAVPPQSRGTLAADVDRFSFPAPAPDFWRITGGSTGTPLRLPAWRSELEETEANEWFARSWVGIAPHDPSMRLWGHSHGLRSGWRGVWNRYSRRKKDAALGIFRVSAYDLSEERLHAAFQELNRRPYVYLLGYSRALVRFANLVQERNWCIQNATLQRIIATAESFLDPENDIRFLERVFHCPLEMEYGSVETHTLAHTRGDRRYHVFWDSYWVETVPTEQPGRHRVLVTSLYPRACPLLRYELGDLLVDPDLERGTRSFAAVVGRCNDWITLPSGTVIHSEAIAHAVTAHPKVQAYQLLIEDSALTLRLVVREPLHRDDHLMIHQRLDRMHSELASVAIQTVRDLETSPAGKRPQVIDRRTPNTR